MKVKHVVCSSAIGLESEINKFTKKHQFIEKPDYILHNSKLLVKHNCRIINGVLYEKLDSGEYRFFFSTDDYDYLVDKKSVKKIKKLFNTTYRGIKYEYEMGEYFLYGKETK